MITIFLLATLMRICSCAGLPPNPEQTKALVSEVVSSSFSWFLVSNFQGKCFFCADQNILQRRHSRRSLNSKGPSQIA